MHVSYIPFLQKYCAEQFEQYVNLFGTGMVIYWFDYVDKLDDSVDFCLFDRFPRQFVLPASQRLLEVPSTVAVHPEEANLLGLALPVGYSDATNNQADI